MSRSYKKHPIYKDRTDGMKTLANHKVRKVPIELTDTLQGGGYMRHFESWDISDYTLDGMWADEDEIGTFEWRKTYKNK